MLTRAQLTDYANWIGKSPVEVRKAVIERGGWSDVLPDKQPFPLWASRVRNYFNNRPARAETKRFDKLAADALENLRNRGV